MKAQAMTKPDFAQIARDLYVDSCGEPTHVEIEAALEAAYRAGMERAAQIADERASRADGKFAAVVRRARNGGRNLELAASTAAGMDHEARNIAKAIRKEAEGEE